jgi:hypothetical protein
VNWLGRFCVVVRCGDHRRLRRRLGGRGFWPQRLAQKAEACTAFLSWAVTTVLVIAGAALAAGTAAATIGALFTPLSTSIARLQATLEVAQPTITAFSLASVVALGLEPLQRLGVAGLARPEPPGLKLLGSKLRSTGSKLPPGEVVLFRVQPISGLPSWMDSLSSCLPHKAAQGLEAR